MTACQVSSGDLPAGGAFQPEDLSVEQGVRFFRDEAYLEEASARREAERASTPTRRWKRKATCTRASSQEPRRALPAIPLPAAGGRDSEI